MRRPPDADLAVRCVDLSLSRTSLRGHHHARVVDGVTLDLEHGRTLAVMGPTGGGKSTLAHVLAGADGGVTIVGGAAWVEGVPIRRSGRPHKLHAYVTGHIPQAAGARLPARLTVADVIGEPITSRDRRVNARALAVRVAGLLDELMLPLGAAPKYPYELSAGMRQRVAIARALILQPRLLVADDPYVNLDVEVRRATRDAFLRRRDEYGMSALVVTNEVDAVRELDADVLVLRAGHVVAAGHGTDDLSWTPSGEADRRLVV